MRNISFSDTLDYPSDFFTIDLKTVFKLDLLNEPRHLVSEALSSALLIYSNAASSTSHYRRSLLHDSLFILASLIEPLSFEKMKAYYEGEEEFVKVNLKAKSLAAESNDELLQAASLNIIPLPFDDFHYFLKDELRGLASLENVLSSHLKSLGMQNLIIREKNLRFSDKLLENADELVISLLLLMWGTIISSNSKLYGSAVFDISNLSRHISSESYSLILENMPESSKKQLIL